MKKENMETTTEELNDLMDQVSTGEFVESVRLIESDDESDGYTFNVAVIEEGMNVSGTREYTKNALASVASQVKNLQCFVDHPTQEDRYERSLRDLFGWYSNGRLATNTEGKKEVRAKLHILKDGPNAEVAKMIRESIQRGNPSLVGLSIRGKGQSELVNERGKIFERVHSVLDLMSADAVTKPGAGGKVRSIAESENEDRRSFYMDLSEMSVEDILAARPDLKDSIKPDESDPSGGNKEKTVVVTESDTPPTPEGTGDADAVAEAKQILAEANEAKKTVTEVKESVSEILETQRVEAAAVAVEKALGENSKLPDAMKDMVRGKLSGKAVTAEEITEAISGADSMWERLLTQKVPGAREFAGPTAEITKDERAGLLKRLDATVLGKPLDGHSPFTGLKEAYLTIRGSSDFTPLTPQSEVGSRILAESAGYPFSLTMPMTHDAVLQEAVGVASGFTNWSTILGTSIHRIMLMIYNEGPYREWERIVSGIDISSDLKEISYSRLGGYPGIPVVAEGAQYTNTPDPTEVSPKLNFKKFGRHAAMTLEAIINDDMRALQRIPRELALASQFQIYKEVFGILTANATYNWIGANNNNLFHTSQANNGTAALTADSLEVGVKAMRLQSNAGTARPLATYPKMLLVPTSLDDTSWSLVNSGVAVVTGKDATQPNIFKSKYNLEQMVIDYFDFTSTITGYTNTADSNNWFLVADPSMIETIRVALHPAREPEFFMQDEPTVGDVFNKDQLTYKVRFFYGATPVDYRGLYRANVA